MLTVVHNDVPNVLPNLVIENLYIGDYDCSRNKKGLKNLGITHVVACVTENATPYPEDFEYKVVKVLDWDDEDIKAHFESCEEFISKGIEKGKVLVHCGAGISRSSTIVISYLMKKMKLSLYEARIKVAQARPIIQPNDGFMDQLRRFELELKLDE